jgi:2-oxoglutarate dehydrogenase complex dehydrogenase (E1) component-like enzyme
MYIFFKIQYCGRSEAATIATGVSAWHQKEAADILVNTFKD